MQIFFLATCPVDAARQQCDQHVIKMLLESAQLLYAAHHRFDDDFDDWPDDAAPYKATHLAHPDALWTASCVQNYRWLHRHACALALFPHDTTPPRIRTWISHHVLSHSTLMSMPSLKRHSSCVSLPLEMTVPSAWLGPVFGTAASMPL